MKQRIKLADNRRRNPKRKLQKARIISVQPLGYMMLEYRLESPIYYLRNSCFTDTAIWTV